VSDAYLILCQWPLHRVKKNIARYGGDAKLVVISGESAGAHLAALAAVTPNHPDFQPTFKDEDTSVQGMYVCTVSLLCPFLTATQRKGCVCAYGISDMADTHGQWKAHDMRLGVRHPNQEKPSIFINFLQKCVVKTK
jgi:hypothetical protein